MALDKFIKDFSGLTEEYKFYNGEVTLRYEPENHIYYLLTADNQFIPLAGVTSVCHIIDKSNALIPWACKMMAEKLLRTVPVQADESGELWTPAMNQSYWQTVVLEAKSAHKEKLEEAADIGHIAHAWIEEYIKAYLSGKFIDYMYKGDSFGSGTNQEIYMSDPTADSTPYEFPFPADEKAASCCKASLDWMHKHNVRWICTEKKIFSRTWNYAGTMDGKAIVDSCDNPLCCPVPYKDRTAIIDWKSSNYLYIEYLFQTAAYQNADAEEYGQLADERWIIRLGKTSGEFEAWHLPNSTYEEDLSAFLNCLKLYRAVASVEERMKIQKNFIKNAKKQQKAIEKEAALADACKSSTKYKGTRKPTCNGGNPCKACLAIYEKVQLEKHAAQSCTCDGGSSLCKACTAEKALTKAT